MRDAKKRVDTILLGISDLFDRAYPKLGRPGIPPEILLKALLLQALYSIRSEKQLLERIDVDSILKSIDQLLDAQINTGRATRARADRSDLKIASATPPRRPVGKLALDNHTLTFAASF